MSDTNLSEIVVKTIDGTEKKLGDYAGKVLLIVNVASEWGMTPQYSGLEELYQEYKGQGLAVLGFPCNDFGGQEPGTKQEIQDFVTSRFGVTFDMFDKLHAKGPQQHPLYARLTNSVEPKGEVGWNFEKFLVNKQGEVVARFKSRTEPGSEELLSAIERELKS